MSYGARLCQLAGVSVRWLIAPVIVFVATSVDRSYQTDFWHHLARGRAMAEQGRIVNEDLFTYTVAGQQFQDNNWLTQLFYHAVFQLGGLPLVQTVNSLTLALTFGLLVWMARKKCGSLPVACAVGVFAFFGTWQLLIIRPQTFSLLLFVLLYATLDFSERRRGLLLVAPLIMALWSNLHGGFPIGLVLIGGYLVIAMIESGWENGWGVLRDGRVWALAGCLLLSVAATCVNPYGPRIWLYVRQTSALASGRRIDEWVPPGMDLFIGKVWVLSVVGLLVLFAWAKRRPTVREVTLVACFLPLACGSVRMVAWWMLILAPIVATLLADNLPRSWLAEEEEQPSPVAVGALALMLFVAVFCAPVMERYNPVLPMVRSTHRTEYDLAKVAERLSRDGGRRVFSRFEWGEYFGWALAGRATVFMDARIEIYPDDVWQQYAAVTRARGDWQEILDGYRVDALILDADYHPDLLTQVRKRPAEWKQTLEVGKVLLFERAGNPY
jgi:hypothetical protein